MLSAPIHCRARSKSTSDTTGPSICSIQVEGELEHSSGEGHNKAARKSEPGIICTNTDLHSILTAKDSYSSSLSPDGLISDVPRKSLTLVRKCLAIRGFLSHEMSRANHDQIFEKRRRISTGSVENGRCNKKAAKSLSSPVSGNGSASGSGGRSPVHRVVAWDEDKDVAIDPVVIGSVIENFLKQQEEAAAAASASGGFLQVHQEPGYREKRGASVSFEQDSLQLPCVSRRARSVDMTGSVRSNPTPHQHHQPQQKRYLIVDEADRPRKLSLRSGTVPKITMRDFEMEEAFAEMAL